MSITSKCRESFTHTQRCSIICVMQFTVVNPRELYFLKLSLLALNKAFANYFYATALSF